MAEIFPPQTLPRELSQTPESRLGMNASKEQQADAWARRRHPNPGRRFRPRRAPAREVSPSITPDSPVPARGLLEPTAIHISRSAGPLPATHKMAAPHLPRE